MRACIARHSTAPYGNPCHELSIQHACRRESGTVQEVASALPGPRSTQAPPRLVSLPLSLSMPPKLACTTAGQVKQHVKHAHVTCVVDYAGGSSSRPSALCVALANCRQTIHLWACQRTTHVHNKGQQHSKTRPPSVGDVHAASGLRPLLKEGPPCTTNSTASNTQATACTALHSL
jgi:hypothetical protein